MILTVSPNPSIDQTLVLGERITRGTVQRLQSFHAVAGGKGVNVSGACALAGQATRALFISPTTDPFVHLVANAGIDTRFVPTEDQVRTNITIIEPGGETSKLNGAGPLITLEVAAALADAVLEEAERLPDNSWIVLAGSLPPGLPEWWYAEIIPLIRQAAPTTKIAVDTSDAPLRSLTAPIAPDRPSTTLRGEAKNRLPDLLKPNAFELAQLVQGQRDAASWATRFEQQAERGDYSGVVAAARTVVNKGIPHVLVTLGPSGAVLATADGAWIAQPPQTDVVSTVGAGDATLAGFLLGRLAKQNLEDCLTQAVAYGTAATTLQGTQMPSPHLVAKVHSKVIGANITG